MQVLHVNLLKNIDSRVLKWDLDMIITHMLDCRPKSRKIKDLNQWFNDYLKRTIVNQWGVPFVDNEQTAYQTSYINSIWKLLRCNAKTDHLVRYSAREGLDHEVINQLDLSQLVRNLNKKFHKDNRWAYQLCYGIGVINFYEFDPYRWIVTMTNDSNFFDEFDSPLKPNLSYSAKIIFAGFDEMSPELNYLKLNLHNQLSIRKHYFLI